MPTTPSRVLLGLQGRWVLVTGSTRGIGRASAEAFARAGANVVVTSRHREDARDVAAELAEDHGVEVLAVEADVADRGSVRGLFEEVEETTGGRLHALVNNAGYPWRADRWNTPLHEVPGDALTTWFDEVRDVDLQGARYCTYEALQLMVPRGRGALVFVSSTPALAGYRGTPYTEAKAGVLGLMRDVAAEYGAAGIRANAVAPGNVRTEAMEEVSEGEREALAREAALGRWGEPHEVAGAIVFLASELASFVTGQTLVVDGGTERR